MQRHLQVGMQRQPIDSLRQTKHCCKDLSHCSPCLQHQSRMLCTLQHIIRHQSLCKMHQQPATQQVKEKRVARAHAHEARAERIIEFYAAARKIDLCTAFRPCTSHLKHENRILRDLTETGQISSHSSSCLSFQLILSGFKAQISI